MRPEDFMRRAVELAIQNAGSGPGGPFGCVVVQGGTILAEGVNLVTSTNDPTAHAEIVAIREACRKLGSFQLAGCDIYASCEPCPMCLGAIYWARPAAIYFGATHVDAASAGFDDSFIYQQARTPVAARSIPMTQILGEEAKEPFQVWMRTIAKTPY